MRETLLLKYKSPNILKVVDILKENLAYHTEVLQKSYELSKLNINYIFFPYKNKYSILPYFKNKVVALERNFFYGNNIF